MNIVANTPASETKVFASVVTVRWNHPYQPRSERTRCKHLDAYADSSPLAGIYHYCIGDLDLVHVPPKQSCAVRQLWKWVGWVEESVTHIGSAPRRRAPFSSSDQQSLCSVSVLLAIPPEQ